MTNQVIPIQPRRNSHSVSERRISLGERRGSASINSTSSNGTGFDPMRRLMAITKSPASFRINRVGTATSHGSDQHPNGSVDSVGTNSNTKRSTPTVGRQTRIGGARGQIVHSRKRQGMIWFMNMRNLSALLFFIGLNVFTLFHDPLLTIRLIHTSVQWSQNPLLKEQTLDQLFCQDNGNKSVLCLQDFTQDSSNNSSNIRTHKILPTPSKIIHKIQSNQMFQLPDHEYSYFVWMNKLFGSKFYIDQPCQAFMRQVLEKKTISEIYDAITNNTSNTTEKIQICCTLTLPSAGLFWNLCTTPSSERLIPERMDQFEFRGPMMESTLGLINNYFDWSGCMIDPSVGVSTVEASGLPNETLANINILRCKQLEKVYSITEESGIGGICLLVFLMLVTMACRILKLIKLLFVLMISIQLNRFCLRKSLFVKTFAEDLMYSDPFMQRLNIIISISSLSTLTMHFGTWATDPGWEGILASTHIITWCEGIYVLSGFCARRLRLRITGVNAFILIPIGTRYLLTAFSGASFRLTNTVIKAYYTGNYYADASITILVGILWYAVTIVLIQFLMSFCVRYLLIELSAHSWLNGGRAAGARGGKSRGAHLKKHWKSLALQVISMSERNLMMLNMTQHHEHASNIVPFDSVHPARGTDSRAIPGLYRRSHFEEVIQKSLNEIYGFTPVSAHQLIMKRVTYTPLEWILTSGYFLWGAFLYKMTLRNCIAFLSTFRLCKATPTAVYANNVLVRIKPHQLLESKTSRGRGGGENHRLRHGSFQSQRVRVSMAVGQPKALMNGFEFTPL